MQRAEELRFYRVVAKGHYETDHQILIDNRVHQGRVGYHVITPLRLAEQRGAAAGQPRLDRDWRGPRAACRRSTPPAGLQQITGVATVPAEKIFHARQPEPLEPGWQRVWQNMDMARYAAAVPFPVQPVVVLLDPDSPAGGFTRDWSRLDAGISVHQGYAFQWFMLAAALASHLSFHEPAPPWRGHAEAGEAMTDAVRRSASRRKILLLAALFALPVIVAYALYFSGWRPAATGNYGELVQPVRPIADAALTRLDGGPMRFSELHGKWTLITFSAAECLKPCERNLVQHAPGHRRAGGKGRTRPERAGGDGPEGAGFAALCRQGLSRHARRSSARRRRSARWRASSRCPRAARSTT